MPELINERDLATLKALRADASDLAVRIKSMADRGFNVTFAIADGEVTQFEVIKNTRIDMGDA